MRPADMNHGASSPELLPHQTAFVETFFSPSCKQTLLLRSDVGLGKTAALAATARRLYEEHPNSRVLFLAPSALRFQIADRLQAAGVPCLIVDRFRFREFLDATTGPHVWPSGLALILSADFAKQSDVCASLATISWDLVVAEEGHSYRGMRADLLREVSKLANRVVIEMQPHLEAPKFVIQKEFTEVEWRRDRVVDRDGNLLFAPVSAILDEVSFEVTPEEIDIRRAVLEMGQLMGGSEATHRLRTGVLVRSLDSSPAAIEGVLQSIVERRVAYEDALRECELFADQQCLETVSEELGEPTREQVSQRARSLLQQIEEAGTDSKAEAFGRRMAEVLAMGINPREVAVLTNYVATLYYLSAELDGLGIPCMLLHGGMDHLERQEALRRFYEEDKVLIATNAMMFDGINLCTIKSLIFYDLPNGSAALQQVIGRFHRFGRREQLDIHVLAQSKNQEAGETGPLERLRSALGMAMI